MFIKKTSRRDCRGFSLLELLLVLTLAPIVFFAVFSNFSTGIRLWQRVQVETPEEDLAIFLLKAQRDFEGAMRYSPMPFRGDSDEVAFASGVVASPELGGARAIGEVRYFYDASARGIAREIRDLSQIYQEKPGKTSLMLRPVGSFELFYLVWDPLASQYEWKSEYRPEKPGQLPLAVRLTYSVPSIAGAAEQTFFLPAGGA